MIKYVVLFKMREGADPEEYWKWWEKVYAPPHVLPGLIRYSINRVIRVLDGNAGYWGMAELCFENEEAYYKMLELPAMKKVLNGEETQYLRATTTDYYAVWMEEKLIAENGALVKRR
jgi:uncharacterized protein (TIGR02118 family)